MSEDANTESTESAATSFLTRDAILGAPDLDYEIVIVPEWKGAAVRVRSLTATDRDLLEDAMVQLKAGKRTVSYADFRARLCAFSIVDAAGDRIFTDADIPALGAKSGAALDRISTVASRLSKMSAQDIKDMVGNSDAAPSDAS